MFNKEMKTMKWILALIAGLLIAGAPGTALADEGEKDDLLLRIDSDVVVRSDETVGSLVVIDGDVLIDGRVTNNVFVVDGDVVVTGAVSANLTVVSGRLELRSGALVKNVTTIDSDLIQADGATVTGEINDPEDIAFASGIVGALSFLFWGAMTIAVVVAGLAFAAIGGRQLTASAQTASTDIVNTAIAWAVLWVGVPILAFAAMISLIGLPLGIGLLLFLLPAMWFLGYIVAGAALGSVIVSITGREESGSHPYVHTLVGLLLLQLVALVPVIGAMVAVLAGTWGAGALGYIAFRASGGKPFWSGANPTNPQEIKTQPAG